MSTVAASADYPQAFWGTKCYTLAAVYAGDKSISSLWNFGGATAAIPSEATASGDRSLGWMYSLDSVCRDAADDDEVMGWTRTAWNRARRHAHDGRLYLDFAGQDADSDELTCSAFSKNYSRLAQIKKRYDPTNMFCFNQNFRPE